MINKPTHQVVITISSHEGEPEVNLQVNWNPMLDDSEIAAQGYTPAAYTVAEHLLFATETMIDASQLFEIEEGDLDASRSIN